MVSPILEPKPNGRWYSKHEDGSECENGYVQTWEPFGRLVLAWQINGNFQYDPNLHTEVEINFISEGPQTTRVTLQHRDLEKLSGGSKVIADMDKGWGDILQVYKTTSVSQSIRHLCKSDSISPTTFPPL